MLVDEINRAMPKTQAALLEAMAEQQVTIDGLTRQLPSPFLLLATENPIEYEGTFPLPEAQLDRFFLKTSLGYPSLDDELLIIDDQREHHPLATLRPVVTVEEVELVAGAVRDVYLDPLLARWIVELVRSTRDSPAVAVGASVRGSLALERAARGWALLHDRAYVTPVDVEHLFLPVLGHRDRVHAEDARRRPPHRLGRRAGRRSGRRRSTGCRRRPSSSSRIAGAARMSVRDAVFPLVPRRRLMGLAFGTTPRWAPRRRQRHRRLAAVRSRRRHGRDRLVGVRACALRRGARTSSSCASTSPTTRPAS